jgi:hypothetical protein
MDEVFFECRSTRLYYISGSRRIFAFPDRIPSPVETRRKPRQRVEKLGFIMLALFFSFGMWARTASRGIAEA